jgi:hypothetical protein
MCTHPSLGKIHIAGVRSISQGGVSAAKSEPPVGAATNGDAGERASERFL